MRQSLLFFIWFSAQIVCAQSTAYNLMLNSLLKKSVPIIKVNEVEIGKKYIILDIRSKAEYQVSHIAGAQWLDYDTFSLNKVRKLTKNKPILVYCSVGARSEQIGEKLLAAGFKDVHNLWGGLFEWVNQGKPIVTAKNTATTKVHAYSPEWGIWLQKGEKVY